MNNSTAKIFKCLVAGIKDSVYSAGYKKAIVGISGGIDSALTAALAVKALGKENVLGLFMPGPHTTKESKECAFSLAKNLNIELKEVGFDDIYYSFIEKLKPHFKGKDRDATEENLQARIRANILMAFSNKFGYFVLNTGNKSEGMVGYCTLYGDSVGGISVLGNVYKTRVYELSRYINREKEIIPIKIIHRAPSAELSKNQKDSDDLPKYELLDKMLMQIENCATDKELVDSGFSKDDIFMVRKLIKQNSFKSEQCPKSININ